MRLRINKVGRFTAAIEAFDDEGIKFLRKMKEVADNNMWNQDQIKFDRDIKLLVDCYGLYASNIIVSCNLIANAFLDNKWDSNPIIKVCK